MHALMTQNDQAGSLAQAVGKPDQGENVLIAVAPWWLGGRRC